MRLTSGAACFAIAVLCLGDAGNAAEMFISGGQPDRRPEGAPKITTMTKDAKWEAKYLTGVVAPAPTTLGLKDQGRWYTPFENRGMTPPYDPRGWWTAQKAKAARR